MFFGYPVAATSENWLHDCLVEMVATIHTKIDGSKSPLKWPDCIPAPRRSILKARHGLKERLNKYELAVQKLPLDERARILRCMAEQNMIGDLVSCKSGCDSLTDLPEAVRAPVDDLFTFAFGLLTELGIRDRHYKIIFDRLKIPVCPFCGCEYFDAPARSIGEAIQGPRHIREDLDHYLPRDRYPFAAANLRNLSPMGGRCNSYKLAQDVLRNTNGARRRSFDPYAERNIAISLSNSIPFKGKDGKKPNWRIEFAPHSPECVTWDTVFSFKERLLRDVLDPSFEKWLRDFATWFRAAYGDSPTDPKVVSALDKYAKNEAIKGLNAREFLRPLVFRMLHRHCAAKHKRLLALIKDVLTDAIPPRTNRGK